MRFVDSASVMVEAGKGGRGCLSFRREKYIPDGGPDGGDGGDGGSIFFRGQEGLNTLSEFRYNRLYRAKNGLPGEGSDRRGKSAIDMYVEVPLGTKIIDLSTDEVIGEITLHKQDLLVAKGGFHGLGNARFKSSRNQAPRKFTLGFEGDVRFIRLELKSLADVGLVGFPNAGKSTFLNKVSSAKPKIGSYPFTTLRPHLGTIEGSESSFVIADIPGLIEGASEGAGLGIKFLQHISRTGLLLIFVDLYSSDDLDPIDQIRLLKNELSAYKEDLTQKVSWVVCNKIDLINKEDRMSHSKDIQEALNISKKDIFFISAATGEGTQKLLQSLEEVISQSKLDLT